MAMPPKPANRPLKIPASRDTVSGATTVGCRENRNFQFNVPIASLHTGTRRYWCPPRENAGGVALNGDPAATVKRFQNAAPIAKATCGRGFQTAKIVMGWIVPDVAISGRNAAKNRLNNAPCVIPTTGGRSAAPLIQALMTIASIAPSPCGRGDGVTHLRPRR